MRGLRAVPAFACALLALAGAQATAAPRTIASPVDEYLVPVRAGAAAPHEPGSIRLVRNASDPASAEAISSQQVRDLLAPCVRGNASGGPLPSSPRQFRIRQEWRCDGASGYSGIVATFITTRNAERLQEVELVLREQPFASPSPPPPPPPPPGRNR